MKVLVLGGAGMLGHRLAETLSQSFETSATFRDDGGPLLGLPIYRRCRRLLTGGEIQRPDAPEEAIDAVGPEVVVNCVGLVKQREEAEDPVASMAVNAAFPHRLAELCGRSGVRLIHISTDCVFSGRQGGYTENDIPDPVDLYGRGKIIGPLLDRLVTEIREMYERRRNVLCDGLSSIGWQVERPKATMFVWAKIPDRYLVLGSLEFSKKLLAEAKVAVSPGIGFGDHGDDHVRFGLIENEHRTRQAIRGIRDMFRRDAQITGEAS